MLRHSILHAVEDGVKHDVIAYRLYLLRNHLKRLAFRAGQQTFYILTEDRLRLMFLCYFYYLSVKCSALKFIVKPLTLASHAERLTRKSAAKNVKASWNQCLCRLCRYIAKRHYAEVLLVSVSGIVVNLRSKCTLPTFLLHRKSESAYSSKQIDKSELWLLTRK